VTGGFVTGGFVTTAAMTVDGSDRALLREAVRKAVDFRGDVTLELTDGSAVSGYAFDARLSDATRLANTINPESEEIRILPAESAERTRIPLASIRTLRFTGKDAASGKSWESWIRRYAEKRLAGEAASIESEPL
jgi:hypothetical protein